MNDSNRQLWVRIAIVGILYTGIGLTSSRLAAALPFHAQFWRLCAFGVSGLVLLGHITYERVRLRNSLRATAWHASAAVAFGAFAIACAANIRDLASTSGYRPSMLIALVAWPFLTAVPTFVVALVIAAVLGWKRR